MTQPAHDVDPTVNIADGHVPALFQTVKGFRWACSCGEEMPEHIGWEDVVIAATSWGTHLFKQ